MIHISVDRPGRARRTGITRSASSAAWSRMTDLGQEDQFPSPSLSGRCRLGEATFAGMGGNGQGAPQVADRIVWKTQALCATVRPK